MHYGRSSSPGYQALAVSLAFESSFPFSSSSAAKYWRGLLQFLVLAVLIGQPKKMTMLLYEIVAMFTFIKLYSFLHWVWGSLHMVWCHSGWCHSGPVVSEVHPVSPEWCWFHILLHQTPLHRHLLTPFPRLSSRWPVIGRDTHQSWILYTYELKSMEPK